MAVRSYLPAATGARVLEVGGGNGFQTAWLRSWGYEVVPIDIEPGRWLQRHARVLLYDGVRLPFAAGSFDAVFSSNVLEHVNRLSELLAEFRRVMKPGGVALHILPTPVWRVWTLLGHYPSLFRRLLFGPNRQLGIAEPSARDVIKRRSLRQLVYRALVPAPHGAFRSSFEEILAFRRGDWTRRFELGGFAVSETHPTGLFYSGNLLAPWLPLDARRALARILGSSCRIFVLRSA